MPITKPAMYVPMRHVDFEFMGWSFGNWFKSTVHNAVLWGGTRSLREFDPNTKLYLTAHTHSALAKFNIGDEYWTGDEMANLIAEDQLSREHRDIELLACRAGASMGTTSRVRMFRRLQENYERAKKTGNEKAIKKAREAFEKAEKKAPKPTPFTGDKNQQIPLAAELMNALKERGYSKLRITAYTLPVNPQFTAANGIALYKPPNTNILVENAPEHTVVWR